MARIRSTPAWQITAATLAGWGGILLSLLVFASWFAAVVHSIGR